MYGYALYGIKVWLSLCIEVCSGEQHLIIILDIH